MDNLPPLQSATAQLWERLQNTLEDQINLIHKEEAQTLQIANRGIQVSTRLLQELLDSVRDYAFEKSEEVRFYKETKPYFLSRLIFYTRLYDLEMDRSQGLANGLEEYYVRAMQRLSKVYEDHRFIYRYLRSGATHLDEQLFFHSPTASVVALYGIEPTIGAERPVCYDHVVAQLLAADLAQAYLQDALDEVRLRRGATGSLPKVTWTDSKTSLIELAYALQSAGVLNNGKIDLKDVIEHLQGTLNIDLGNYPRTFQEILSRKTGYTTFIDRLKAKLLLRIQHIEDKYDRG